MVTVDLHTHSVASPDGGLRAEHYRHMLAQGPLHYIAVTDHNRIDFGLALQAELGERIIVGEEITTAAGEIIGLYLTEAVPAGLTAEQTVAGIHEQGGLVYIPHPFETVRQGLTAATLETIADRVDIMETWNGRTLQNRGSQATDWATAHHVAGASSSDAHGPRGWGKTYSQLRQAPSRQTLVALLQDASQRTGSVGLIGRLYPKLNRLRSHR